MKRKLLAANLVLLGLAIALGLQLRQQWLDADAREQAFLQRRIKPVAPPPITPLPAAQPVRAAGYIDIAQKDLFSKDRNPTVIVEAPPVKVTPMPKLPLFHGLVDFGDGPMAIMSEGPKAPHRDYTPGDKIGAFKLVSVDNDQIVLEWEGQTITKSVDEMLDHTAQSAPPPAAPAVTASAPPPPPKPTVTGEAKPGYDLGKGIKGCQAGDKSPAGTVADGMRKVLRPTPFGTRCYWEPAN